MGGRDEHFIVTKGHIGKFRIRAIWNYLFNQATNTVIKWLKMERRKKAVMGGYTEK